MSKRFSPIDLLFRQAEPVRFLVVGVGNTAFNYALFAALLWVFNAALSPLAGELAGAAGPLDYLGRALGNKYYLVTQLVAWVLTVPVSTYTMKHFAFRRDGDFWPQVGRSFGVYLPAQALELTTIWLIVAVGGFHPLIGKLGAVALATVVSYIGHKHFTFGGQRPAVEPTREERAL